MFDKYTIANQQFDNAKREAKDVLRNNFVNAWKNRGMAATVNDLYANQYHWDPVSGTIKFNPNARNFKYDMPSAASFEAMPKEYKSLFTNAVANKDYDVALDILKTFTNSDETSSAKSKRKTKDNMSTNEPDEDLNQQLLRLLMTRNV
jgi:hypothetical protein